MTGLTINEDRVAIIHICRKAQIPPKTFFIYLYKLLSYLMALFGKIGAPAGAHKLTVETVNPVFPHRAPMLNTINGKDLLKVPETY
jgi:hypothetical protein